MLYNDARAHDAQTLLGVTGEQMSIMLHALGIQCRNGNWSRGGWRNHYNASETSDSYDECKALMAGGWMTGVQYQPEAQAWNFRVSAAGQAALRLCGFLVEEVK